MRLGQRVKITPLDYVNGVIIAKFECYGGVKYLVRYFYLGKIEENYFYQNEIEDNEA